MYYMQNTLIGTLQKINMTMAKVVIKFETPIIFYRIYCCYKYRMYLYVQPEAAARGLNERITDGK